MTGTIIFLCILGIILFILFMPAVVDFRYEEGKTAVKVSYCGIKVFDSTKEKPEKIEWKPEIGFTEEGFVKIKMPYIVRDENFDIWLNYRTCVAQFFEEFVSEHVDKPFNDCLFYAKFIYPETIDESMFGDHKEMALKWSSIFIGVRSPSSIGSGNFVGEKLATEIYLLPKDKYDEFKIKYLKN